MAWTHDNIERLKALWSEGKTGGQIAQIIGVPRNAVIGKARRLNLDPRTDPIETTAEKFERVIDLIVDFDVPLDLAAKQLGMPHEKAIVLWRKLVARIGWQAV